MSVYNLTKIENWYDDFLSYQSKFKNTYYEDYKSSYIMRYSSDAIIAKMKKELSASYNRINKIYTNLNKFWKEFLEDVEITDLVLANERKSSSINASSVAAKLSKLPQLDEYTATAGIVLDYHGASKFIDEVKDWASTGAVLATTVVSAAFNLLEEVYDGVLMVAGTVSICFFEETEDYLKFQEWIMDEISTDHVKKINEIIYEKTEIGKEINDRSKIKYDGETAKIIQNVTEKGLEIIAATAVSVLCPASSLILLGGGFLMGTGEKAEESFSNGNRDFWGSCGEIYIAGAIKAVEVYSEGSMLGGPIKTLKNIKAAGGLANFVNGIKTVWSLGGKVTIKNAAKMGLKSTFTDIDTYVDTFGAAANSITYDKETGWEVDWEQLTAEVAAGFALNGVTGFVGGILDVKKSGFEDFIEQFDDSFGIKPSAQIGINENISAEKKKRFSMWGKKEAQVIKPIEVKPEVKYSSYDIENAQKQYAKLLRDNPDLIQTLDDAKSGKAIALNQETRDLYMKSRELEMIIKNGSLSADDIRKNVQLEPIVEQYTKLLRDNPDVLAILKNADEGKGIAFYEQKTIDLYNQARQLEVMLRSGTISIDDIRKAAKNISQNELNFEKRIEDSLNYEMKKFNYYMNLKNKGIYVDPKTGEELKDLDDILRKSEIRISALGDLKYKDDVVFTQQEYDLYKVIEDSIETLNSKYAAEHGNDIGIKQLTGYIKTGNIRYIPNEYRELIGNYSLDEINNMLLFMQKIEDCNNFKNQMFENYVNSGFLKYVDGDRIMETKKVNILLSPKAFEAIRNNDRSMAFNDGSNSYMNLIYSSEILKANMSHENIHQLSANKISGIRYNDTFTGINETFTEYINKLAMGVDYPKKTYCGYQPMVTRLEMLVENNVLTEEDILSSYFANDVTIIQNKINALGGNDNYFNELVGAFESAHASHSKDLTKLDEVCRDLVFKKIDDSLETTLELKVDSSL